jgi:hypothetical protein
MFQKLKKTLEERKAEQAQLREYEKKLREESLKKEKDLRMQAKKKVLDEKYSRLQAKYSKTPAERRAEFAKKYDNFRRGEGNDFWGNLGKATDNAMKNLRDDPFARPVSKPATKVRYGRPAKKQSPSNDYIDKFLRGDFK